MPDDLPLCRWRGDALADGRWQCSSPKLVVGPDGVPGDFCAGCYCCDHAPIVALPAVGRCSHLGRRCRDDQGVVITRYCGDCGGKRLDLHHCNHPAKPDEVTLADCQTCSYGPGPHAWRPDGAGILPAFERVYLINLARRKDRWHAFKLRQETHGWRLPSVELFSAIEGETVGVPAYFREGGGAWGCLRSHVAILERCLMEGVGSVLVLEDDVEWFSGCWGELELFLQRVPGDWSQLMLGGQHMATPTPVQPGVVRVHNCQRTHAYALRGPAIKSLLRAWYTASVHLDWVMGGDWQRGWPVYAPDPFVFGQAGGRSDISGRLNNALYWNAPTNATVAVLRASPATAAELRTHGLHMGFRRNAEGYDQGLARIAGAGCPSDQLQSWLATLLWEVASMEGRLTTVFHPAVTLDMVKNIHGGEVIDLAGDNAGEVLHHLRGRKLQRSFSSSHVLLLRADRAVVEAIVGFHRGYWTDADTGYDRGQQQAVAGDLVAGLQKWMRHAGEESERMGAVPMIWHEAVSAAAAAAAFPERTIVELSADSPANLYAQWRENVC